MSFTNVRVTYTSANPFPDKSSWKNDKWRLTLFIVKGGLHNPGHRQEDAWQMLFVVKEIDINDIDFVALTKLLEGALWTGHKISYNGLKAAKFQSTINTTELIQQRM